MSENKKPKEPDIQKDEAAPADEKKAIRGILHEVMGNFSKIDYIRPEDIPDIPLYMDQITTFMDSKLENCKRYPEDKILTKTMINNYTKNKLIPPPEKKKYSKEHLILLIMVYYLKDFLSIGDIKKLLLPLEGNHFQSSENLSISDLYEKAYDLVNSQSDSMAHDLFHKWKAAKEVFPETTDPEDKKYLDTFALITLLSFDVYVKKQAIEGLIDALPDEDEKN
ncbi:MAG: DUF1836 domain-containing protein [Lachnospiraceae bacterium]|nr:DUF1836 domain-containing protein [Lachnospiraceae bacterium]